MRLLVVLLALVVALSGCPGGDGGGGYATGAGDDGRGGEGEGGGGGDGPAGLLPGPGRTVTGGSPVDPERPRA